MANLKFILSQFGGQKFKISVLHEIEGLTGLCFLCRGSGEIEFLGFSSFQWLPTQSLNGYHMAPISVPRLTLSSPLLCVSWLLL